MRPDGNPQHSVPPPTLSVLMVNYNTGERTCECLESLYRNGVANMQVVLVDNGSKDDSVALIGRRFPEVRIIEAGGNLGFARAVNLAADNASGEHLLLLNPDATVLPGALEALQRYAVAHPRNGVYGGRTEHTDGSVDTSSSWGRPTLWSMFCYASGLSTVFKRNPLFDPESLGSWNRDTVREVPIVTGALFMVPRDVWRRVGGMDRLYFLYGEDADFCRRAEDLGYRPVVVPAARVQHDGGGSTGGGGTKLSMVWAGRVTYLRRHWPAWQATLGVAALQGGALLRATGETVLRSSHDRWRTVWRRRRDWRPGFPHAEQALFTDALAGVPE
jgi:GT2 family glycosyltransferase